MGPWRRQSLLSGQSQRAYKLLTDAEGPLRVEAGASRGSKSERLGLWLRMVQEEPRQALGTWVEGDPRSSEVSETAFPLPPRLAFFGWDGAVSH